MISCKKTFILITLICISQTSSAKVAPGVAGTLSVIPGLGQVANGDIFEGLAWFGTTATLVLSGHTFLSRYGLNIWYYNTYDAYRDAKPKNKKYQEKSVFINYLNAYNPINLIDPFSPFIVGLSAVANASGGYPSLRSPYKIIEMGFIGLGEEGLFRGFLFPAFSDVFNSSILGAITSSTLFSLAHFTKGRGVSLGAFVYRLAAGLVFCGQVAYHDYDLRHAIFSHAWYDMFVPLTDGVSIGIRVHLN